MSQMQDFDSMTEMPLADQASVQTRADFIRKTYLHLIGAILAFIGIEAAIFANADTEAITQSMMGGGMNWLFVLGAFMLVSWVANSWAHSGASPGLQYAGLTLYVVAEAVIFVPLLCMADRYGVQTGHDEIIPTAGLISLIIFGGLTAIVFATAKDFSFMRGALMLGGIGAMGMIVGSIVFSFSLGLVFVVFMIVLASGYILYTASNVLHHYRIGQHVAASLALFAAIALLFWYVLRLLMMLSSRD